MGVMILVAAIAPTLATEAVASSSPWVRRAFAFHRGGQHDDPANGRAGDAGAGSWRSTRSPSSASTPIGGPIVGWISQNFGPRTGFAVGGVAALVASSVAGWSMLHRSRPRATEAPDVMAVPAA